jgi:hypothetical protein
MLSSPDSEESEMRIFGFGMVSASGPVAACCALRKLAGHARAAFSSGDFL